MTPKEWFAEVKCRIGISEGCRLTMYYDTMGIPTIGYGFNLQRGTAALAVCDIEDLAAVIAGAASITQVQADALFALDLPQYVAAARASLPLGIFDRLSDARRFVVTDLTYNLGASGWEAFASTRNLLAAAVDTKAPMTAHALYGEAADHLAASAWAGQVGNRALRDIAMMRSSTWVDANGNGQV
jgi:lysozyme